MNERFTTECIEKIHPSFIEEARTFPPNKPNTGYWKKLLITYVVIIAGVALLLFFTLFRPTHEYRIEKDGDHYLVYLDPKYVPFGGLAVGSYTPLYQNSVAEMERAFRLGDFTTEEFYRLGNYADGHGVVQIFDLDNLIEPNLPDPFAYKVIILPSRYLLEITMQSTGEKMTMQDIPQDHFIQFTDIAAFQETLRVSADATDAQEQLENAYRSTEYETSEACYYIIEGASLTYYVVEYYDTTESEKILRGIEIYAAPTEADGHYLSIQIHEPTERPKISWLAQIGYKPYEP